MRSGGPEADEKQLKKLFTPTTKLKLLQRRIEDLEEKLQGAAQPILKTKLEGFMERE